MWVLRGCIVLAILGAEVLASTTPGADVAAGGTTKAQASNDEKGEGQGKEPAAVAAELAKVKAEEGKVAAELAKVKAEEGKEAAELANVKSQLELAKAEVAKEHSSKQAMEETLATQEKSIASLKAEAKAKDAEVQAKNAEKDAEIAKLKLEAESKSKDFESLKGDHTARVAEIVQLKSDAATQAKKLTERAVMVASLQKNKQDIEAKLLEKAATVKAHTETIASLNDSLDAKQAEYQVLSSVELQLRNQQEMLEAAHERLVRRYADPSVQHFLRAKAVKAYSHPGISGAHNKTFTYVLPSLQAKYATGKELVETSKSSVYSKLHAYVGSEKTDPWLPAISGGLVYGAIIVPFFCTVCCLTRIMCRLRPILLFIHLDLLITTLCAGNFAVYTGKDPLASFADHDPAVYLFTQAAFAIIFCVYLTLLGLAGCCASGYEKTYRCVQICGAAPIFAIYFMYVWTPAMMDEMPHMEKVVEWIVGPGAAVSQFSWLPYLPVSALFLLLLHLERLAWIASGKRGPDEMSVVMRNDIELATVIGDVAYGPVSQKPE